MLRPLREQQSDAARCRVHENDVTGLDAECAMEKVLCRQTLHGHRRGGREVDGVRKRDDEVSGDDVLFGVGTRYGAVVCHPVSGREVANAFSDRHDLTRSFEARSERKGRRRKLARAVVDVGVVETDGPVAYADLTGSGIAGIDVLVDEHFRPAVTMNADRFHEHRSSAQHRSGSGKIVRVRSRDQTVRRTPQETGS